MGSLKAVILGLVQGLTEFLPISSSGHLALAQNLLGFKEPQLFFDVMLHLGTLLAVIAVFRSEIWEILRGRRWGMVWMILLGTVPTTIIGLLLKDVVEKTMVNVYAVLGMLALTGSILLISSWLTKNLNPQKDVDPLRAFGIGIAQGIAVIPGISRSGITISTAMMSGVEPEKAARFSFLLAIPAILGASVLEAKEVNLSGISPLPLVLGVISAFISGYVAIKVLLSTLKRGKFQIFGYYCLSVAALSLFYLVAHRL
mgnify:CR=1 FL=1